MPGKAECHGARRSITSPGPGHTVTVTNAAAHSQWHPAMLQALTPSPAEFIHLQDAQVILSNIETNSPRAQS